MHTFEIWMEQFGYLSLFLGLLLEFIALPFPGELVMGYSGNLVYQGQMDLLSALMLAWLGTSIGSTITYLLGRKLGYPFVVKYGSRLFLGPKKLKKTKDTFEKYGSKLFFFSFFIPGVRHFTGYLAGILNIPFRTFALYSYSGSLLWVVTFIVGGRILGPKWELFHEMISKYSVEITVFIAAVAGMYFLYRKAGSQVDNPTMLLKDSQRLQRIWLILIGGLFASTSLYIFPLVVLDWSDKS